MPRIGEKSHDPSLIQARSVFLSALAQRKPVNPWAGTDPYHHNPNSFRYLVHAINPSVRSVWLPSLLEETIKTEGKQGYKREYDIDLLVKPQRISEKPVISTSLIDQDHPTTWGPGGFILDILPDHVLHSSPEDIGTNMFNPESVKGRENDKKIDFQQLIITKLQSLYITYPVRHNYQPDQLLKISSPLQYNEVVLKGINEDGSPVKIKAVFIKTDCKGRFKDQELALRLQWIAANNNWPVIKLADPPTPAFQDDAPIYMNNDKKIFAFNWQGKRYLFYTESKDYKVLEDGGDSRHQMGEEEKYSALEQLSFLLAKNHPIELPRLERKNIEELQTLLRILIRTVQNN